MELQVPRDGEQPGLESRLAVVRMPALEDADPRLLEKVFGPLFVSCDVHEIAEQAILILLDQPVEQIGVAPPQAARDALCVIAHQRRDEQGWTGTAGGPK